MYYDLKCVCTGNETTRKDETIRFMRIRKIINSFTCRICDRMRRRERDTERIVNGNQLDGEGNWGDT